MNHVGNDSSIHVHPDVFHDLPLNKHASPRLITMIGHREKTHVLSALACNPVDQLKLPHGQVYVRADSTVSSQPPNIYVDCELYNRHSAHFNPPIPFAARTIAKALSGSRAQEHTETCAAFSANVLYPLSEIIYYFATDLGGLDVVANMIAHQVTKYRRIETVKPHLVVVVDDPVEDPSKFSRLLDTLISELLSDAPENFRTEARATFSLSTMLYLGPSNRTARAAVLRKHMTASGISHQGDRHSNKPYFNLQHIEAFLSTLITKFAESPESEFSFLRSSRPIGYHRMEFPFHLTQLLRRVPAVSWLWSFVVPITSASIFLCNYPPGSHCESSKQLGVLRVQRKS